jgi:hypothetical protein
MSSEDYKKLDKIKKFNFSFDMVTKSKAELQEQRDAVKERIDKIVNHFTIDDVPILSYILHVTTSRVELKKLAKAIDRLADLADVNTVLTNKLKVIEAAESDPNWFALAFGDFDQEIDLDIEKFFTQE